MAQGGVAPTSRAGKSPCKPKIAHVLARTSSWPQVQFFFFFSSRHLKVKLLTTSRLDASVSPSYSKRERHRAYLHYQSNAMVPSFLHQNFNKKIFFAHAIRQTKDDFARTMLQFPMALLRTTAWPSI